MSHRHPETPGRTGGQILVRQLVINGVNHVFCVPGESFLAVLDALHDADMRLTVCRQEGGCAMMAEACGKLTGRPGIAFVTRGPGATNASAGVHVAAHDSTPMILFVGQVESGMLGREAFQEIDYVRMFGDIAKWVVEVSDPRRLPEIVSRAFHVALSGRPGPVVISLPEDMLTACCEAADAPPAKVVEVAPRRRDLDELERLMAQATRPIVVAGGSRWDQDAVTLLERFAARFQLPVAVSFRRQDRFPTDNPCFCGDVGAGMNPRLRQAIQASDLVILLGGRLSELPSQGYTLLGVPDPQRTLVHVHPGTDEIGKVYSPRLGFAMSPGAFLAEAVGLSPHQADRRGAHVTAARALYEEWTGAVPGSDDAFDVGRVFSWLRARLPDDAIVCNGAGNYSIWLHRFLRFRRYGTQLAPTSGSMGYGLPAAIAAKRLKPSRMVVAFAGDGCFLMTGQEFATAVHHDVPVVVIVMDNAKYGTIRMHQEREYPGRVVATDLTSPDFAKYAEAFGGHGETVRTASDFEGAFERAVASGRPAILHCLMDGDRATPARTFSQIRTEAEGGRT